MRDRSNSIDLALAFFAALVITMAAWPRTAPRQVVNYKGADGQWSSFSLAIDDPNLKVIRQQVQNWKTPETDPAYVTAKWQMEVAEFYQKSKPAEADNAGAPHSPRPRATVPLSATISDSVITASFEMSLDEIPGHEPSPVRRVGFELPAEADLPVLPAAGGLTAVPNDANYWANVRAAAVTALAAIEARRADSPIDFGAIVPAAWPPLAFHAAFFFGLAAACVYRHWLGYAPLLAGTPYRDQPLRVLVRIGTFSGLVALAVFGSAAVWI